MKFMIEIDGFTTRVYAGDSQIGMIQKLSLQASINNLPSVEIQFPDIPGMSDDIKKQIQIYKNLLSQIQYVKVT
jgi:hypothetical protein